MSIAEQIVSTIVSARRAIQLYPPSHPEYDAALDTLVDSIAQATASGPIALNCYEGQLYCNSTAVPSDARNAETLAEAFESRRIESLTFQPGAGRADVLGLVEVLSLRPSPNLDVEEELAKRGVSTINVALLSKDQDEESAEKDRQRQADRMMYQRALAALRRVQQRLATGGGDIGETGALVGSVMERLLNDPPAVLGLATISGSGERDLFHSLNVMIYALALAQRLGLPEEGLQSLGMAALLHDVGKTAFDRDDQMQARRDAPDASARGCRDTPARRARRPSTYARRVRTPYARRRLRLARTPGRLPSAPVQPHGRDRRPLRESHQPAV